MYQGHLAAKYTYYSSICVKILCLTMDYDIGGGLPILFGSGRCRISIQIYHNWKLNTIPSANMLNVENIEQLYCSNFTFGFMFIFMFEIEIDSFNNIGLYTLVVSSCTFFMQYIGLINR